MRRWTAREDAVLERYGSMGAAACCRIIRQQTGVTRTEHAAQNRASRLGLSLFRNETCPACGRVVKELRRSGLCDRCHHLSYAAPRDVARRLARKVEPTAEDRAATLAAVRRRNAERQARKSYADSVKKRAQTGSETGNPSSEGAEIFGKEEL